MSEYRNYCTQLREGIMHNFTHCAICFNEIVALLEYSSPEEKKEMLQRPWNFKTICPRCDYKLWEEAISNKEKTDSREPAIS